MTRNELGMRFIHFFFFIARDEVGIWSEYGRNLVGISRILLGSARTARIRLECVGEGKVLHFWQTSHTSLLSKCFPPSDMKVSAAVKSWYILESAPMVVFALPDVLYLNPHR